MTRRTITPEFRCKVVEEHLVGGRTIADICREYHLGRNLFDSWRKAYRQAGAPTAVKGTDSVYGVTDHGHGSNRPRHY